MLTVHHKRDRANQKHYDALMGRQSGGFGLSVRIRLYDALQNVPVRKRETIDALMSFL